MAVVNNVVTPLPRTQVTELSRYITPPWQQWLEGAYRVLFAAQQSGTLANRPTAGLWIGRPYFATDSGAHGQPLWISAVSGSGVATWVDATSTIVP